MTAKPIPPSIKAAPSSGKATPPSGKLVPSGAKAVLLMLWLCSACLLLSGCWDRTEINDLGITVADAVDLDPDGQFRLTVQIALPGQMGGTSGGETGGKLTYYIDSDKGSTLEECVRHLQARMPRRLFFAHRRILIVSEQLARKHGIKEVFDVSTRRPENRLTAFMIISKGVAADLLNARPKLERNSGEAILKLARSGQIMNINMKRASQAISQFGANAVLPYMGVKESEKGKEKSQEIEILGYAQLREGILIGTLDRDQSAALQWLSDDFQPYFTTIEAANHKKMALFVQTGKVSILPSIKGGAPHFDIHVQAEAEVWENLTNTDLLHPSNIRQIERLFAKLIERNIRGVIRIMKQNSTDSAGLGIHLQRSHPAVWTANYRRRWKEEFKKSTFSFDIQTHVTRPGLTTKNISEKR